MSMDLFEKVNRSFGSWYEGLFGSNDDVRPKDILRRILAALEDHRKEGFDNKVYVPNQYILEIHVSDQEEKEYLLSFLDRDELEAAIRRFCQQNHYHIRGPLDFTIKERDDSEATDDKRPEKIRVRCRYNAQISRQEAPLPGGATGRMEARALLDVPHEERTVSGVSAFQEEEGTVPSVSAADLIVYAPDRPPFRYAMARGAVIIGRSARIGNDLVIEGDGQMSKRHARIELDSDGRFTLYDLGSTNGTKVNGRRVENRTLHNGDEIVLGATRLQFQQAEEPPAGGLAEPTPARGSATPGAYGGAAAMLGTPADGGTSTPPARSLRTPTARLVLEEKGQDIDDFLLASETLIGRGVTNDIVLPEKSIAVRHARIVDEGAGYLLEALADEAHATRLEGMPLLPGRRAPLTDGDRIDLGSLTLRFETSY